MSEKKSSKGPLRKIKKRLAGSGVLNKMAASLLAAYIKFCHATTKWERRGFEELNEHLDTGAPVIVVVWHERLFFSTYFFDTSRGEVCAITTKSRMAELGHFMLEKFNFSALMVPNKSKRMQFNRQIMQRLKNDVSIVISPDGTRGPAKVAKNFPILWARSTKVPVFLTSSAVRRHFCLPTWDRARLALPFNRGAMLVRRWEMEDIPPRASAEQIEALRLDLTRALNEITDESDRLVRRGES